MSTTLPSPSQDATTDASSSSSSHIHGATLHSTPAPPDPSEASRASTRADSHAFSISPSFLSSKVASLPPPSSAKVVPVLGGAPASSTRPAQHVPDALTRDFQRRSEMKVGESHRVMGKFIQSIRSVTGSTRNVSLAGSLSLPNSPLPSSNTDRRGMHRPSFAKRSSLQLALGKDGGGVRGGGGDAGGGR